MPPSINLPVKPRVNLTSHIAVPNAAFITHEFLFKTTLLTLFLISFAGRTVFSQTATFSGRVTDQTTGHAIPNVAIITLQATDKSMVAYDLVVEDLRKVPDLPWISQLTIRLPNVVTLPKDLAVTVTARDKTSNAVNFQIR